MKKKKADITICSYVDNRLITSRESLKLMCISCLVKVLKEVKKWAYQNGIVFDSAKYKTIHFFRKRDFSNSPITLPDPSFISDIVELRVIKPINKCLSIRWLKVYFDSCLSVKKHIVKMANKRKTAVLGLKMLANTIYGVELIIM